MKHTGLSLKSVVKSRSEISSQLVEPGDAILIIRGEPRWLLLKCPCGCNDEIPVNLDWRAGNAWRIYGGVDEQLTLFPSVWRDTDCRSHFIIRNGKIMLVHESQFDTIRSISNPDFPLLVKRVERSWPLEGWVYYVEIADQLGEIPWDVLDACWSLVQEGILVAGRGRRRSNFRRSRPLTSFYRSKSKR